MDRLIVHIGSTYPGDCSITWPAGWKRNGMRNAKKPIDTVDLVRGNLGDAMESRSGTVEFV